MQNAFFYRVKRINVYKILSVTKKILLLRKGGDVFNNITSEFADEITKFFSFHCFETYGIFSSENEVRMWDKITRKMQAKKKQLT